MRVVRIVRGFYGYLHFAAIMVIKVEISRRAATLNIPSGTYALAIVRGNMNGKLDTNCWEFQKRLRFFKRRKALLGATSVSADSFPYNGENLDLTISLNY